MIIIDFLKAALAAALSFALVWLIVRVALAVIRFMWVLP